MCVCVCACARARARAVLRACVHSIIVILSDQALLCQAQVRRVLVLSKPVNKKLPKFDIRSKGKTQHDGKCVCAVYETNNICVQHKSICNTFLIMGNILTRICTYFYKL